MLAIAFLLLAYTWAGYPTLLCALRFARRSRRKGAPAGLQSNPKVSMIVAVRNEEQNIRAKLADCTKLDYPADQMEILIASDNSTDRTEELVEELSKRDIRVRLLAGRGEIGKSGVQNLAVRHATGDILCFTDADTRTCPDTLKLIVENFADPQVGLATANVHFGQPDCAVAEGQGAYWRFELLLRKLESDLGILATSSGQLLAMRRELFRPLPVMYGDDCVLPLDVRLQGYQVVQDARAVVYDIMPSSIKGEFRARVRMTARNWTGTLARPAILNPFRFPLTSWGLVSHKLLRWLTPIFLAVLLLSNVLLAVRGIWIPLCALQLAFYAAACIGWMRTRKGASAWIFGYPFAFCLANVGFFLGMVKVLRGQKIVSY